MTTSQWEILLISKITYQKVLEIAYYAYKDDGRISTVIGYGIDVVA